MYLRTVNCLLPKDLASDSALPLSDIFIVGERFVFFLWLFLFYLKVCRTILKEDSPAAARETLFIVAAKVESTEQCRTVPVPLITEPPKTSNSWLIRWVVQYLGKMKGRDSGRKKKEVHEFCQLPTSLAAFTDQFREGSLQLKLNLANLCKQEAFPNYTHSVMEA